MDAAQLSVKILSHTKLSRDHFLLTLSGPVSLKKAEPGQFLHVRVSNTTHPLLRRPFSIHRVRAVRQGSGAPRCELDVLYAVKGRGTSLLSKQRSDEPLDIIGPLGNGFYYANALAQPATIILIAGGMGVAALTLLAEKIMEQSRRAHHNQARRLVAVLGAANQAHIFCERHFKNAGFRVVVATEDGSRGFKGTATDLFEKTIAALHKEERKKAAPQPAFAFACGPRAMLNTLAKACLIHTIPLQVSLEEFMGCGIGACLGCVIKTKSGYKRVCSDGPVFLAEDISWTF